MPAATRRTTFPWALTLIITILCLSFLLRFFALDERTIHIDEGMGLRASEIALQGEWTYYPQNGHGPTLFYLGSVIRAVFGTDIVVARATVLIISFAAILVLFFSEAKRYTVQGRALLALLLFSSSGLIFYGNYFIHEPLFLAFTIGAYLAGSRFFETKDERFLPALLAFLVLMYATKETALLTWAAWAAALVAATYLPTRWRSQMKKISPFILIISVCLAFLLHTTLFTSFFANPAGLLDSILSPFLWFERSLTHHVRSPWYFFSLLFVHEPAILGATVLAVILCFRRHVSRRAVFFGVWALSMFTFYSVIRYKTPWCIPTMLLPLILFSVETIERWKPKLSVTRVFLALFLSAITGMSIMISLIDNIGNPNRETAYSYAYLQSDESLDRFIGTLHDLRDLSQEEPFRLQVIGHGDELLHVLTEPYNRMYEPLDPSLPVYVNYESDAEELASTLVESGRDMVRVIFTYIQHVNQIDLFVDRALWNAYVRSSTHVLPSAVSENVYDAR